MKVVSVGFVLAVLTGCTSAEIVAPTAPTADSGYAALPLQGCNTDLRYFNQVLGWQASWPTQWQSIVGTDVSLIDGSILKWSQASKSLATTISELRDGIENQQTVPRIVAVRVHQQVQDLARELSAPSSKYMFANTDHKNALVWNKLVLKSIAPAVSDFEVFLAEEYLPATHEEPGLSSLDGGRACFFNAVTWWTSLTITQDEIEKVGQRVLKDTRAELAATGEKGETVESILARLRLTDSTTAEALIKISETALLRAHEKTASAFSKQAADELIVEKLPVHLQASFPAGRYVTAKGPAPAKYIINPSRPNERRLMAEVIAFHEGVPGHHLWATYPREEPVARPESGFAGLSEGWALYAEYLADEMGLYSSTLDRQGMMAKHLWAASRLIVEPGLHLRGWSREQAIVFMLENTVMSRTEIELEVDRYIAMPGQSLSYILGSSLIMTERERAKEVMGSKFDLKEFHNVVLGSGLRPLHEVRSDIRNWSQP